MSTMYHTWNTYAINFVCILAGLATTFADAHAHEVDEHAYEVDEHAYEVDAHRDAHEADARAHEVAPGESAPWLDAWLASHARPTRAQRYDCATFIRTARNRIARLGDSILTGWVTRF